jgi:hypothetical protein
MRQWATIVGLSLTATGVLIAFYLPKLRSYWGTSEAAERQERWLRYRTGLGAALVIAGTLLQIYGAWP